MNKTPDDKHSFTASLFCSILWSMGISSTSINIKCISTKVQPVKVKDSSELCATVEAIEENKTSAFFSDWFYVIQPQWSADLNAALMLIYVHQYSGFPC